MERRIVVALLLAVIGVLPLSAQDALGTIRKHYAEAQEKVKEMTEREKDGYDPPPMYYQTKVIQMLAGTGRHDELVTMYYFEEDIPGQEWMSTRSLHFATVKYNFAAREFYEEYLYDEKGNLEFIYARNADVADFKGGDFRFYFQNGKLIKALLSVRNPETEKYEQVYSGKTAPPDYVREYKSCHATATRLKTLFKTIEDNTHY